jgi:hypothetical protein
LNAFRFPLQKVLAWRKTELELEEARYRSQLEALAAIDRERARLEGAGAAAEEQVRVWNPVAGGELSALGSFRLHMKHREFALAQPRTECLQKIAAQQQAMLAARRRLRLLERLRERRLAEWTAARDRELEALASESYLASWTRSGP